MKSVVITLAVIFALLSTSALEADEMVFIKGGRFNMGSPLAEISRQKDEVQRQIRVKDFYLAKYELTRKEYQAVMGEAGQNAPDGDLPMVEVSWFEAVRFCNALSLKEGLKPAYLITETGGQSPSVVWNKEADGYRLPTEAEWEYACRAGTNTPFYSGHNITTDQANYYGSYPYNNNPTGEYRNRTMPVGSFAPNPWGLYDMHGNVWEWCWDWYGEYDQNPSADPDGPASGNYRVNRGGGWNDFGRHLRSAYRAAHPPVNSTFNLGFRLARNAD